MADPLLTSLCAICHVNPPKYKCPRCTIQTCSAGCNKRHKTWYSCNGIRDATAYIPPSKLKTPAGVDHDYNFLSSIERAVQRSEKEIVEERRLLRPEDLRPLEVRSVKWKTGKDGRKRRVLVTELLRGDNAVVLDSKSAEVLSSPACRKRLGKFAILLRRAPMGMMRQKENGTTFSKASGRINWQVEWLLVQSDTRGNRGILPQQGEMDADNTAQLATKRIMAKAFDDTPLYRAFIAGQKNSDDEFARKEEVAMQQQQRQQNHQCDFQYVDEVQDANSSGRSKRRRKYPHKPGQSMATAQDTETGAWHPGRYCLQNPIVSSWMPYTGVSAFTGTTEEEEAQKRRYSFFLVGTTSATAAAAGQTVVHSVDATLPLGEALRDMTVLEFPTVYVVETGTSLPSSLISEPKPVRLTPKRKRDDQLLGRKGGKGPKMIRRKLEEGELPSNEDDGHESDDMGAGGRIDALANVIAEESLGEDDDDETATSSSGSDSDEDDSVSASLAAKLALLRKK
ncbi:putative box C/D snoRNA protein [Colletotrichum gloeosporioides]|uniref:Box C/D snoRNA protein 1 n=1 Tax=Colletotrichum gloeosporioides TaxID=474922 RepID=A0A8H4CAN2_COLGL|nr:putative box C/D snoRNA protein [Colletotrichum gloeosporioides]KAF3800486.1 putative box C/D snoRNA protein [Colletotrichum gloeosporioides]